LIQSTYIDNVTIIISDLSNEFLRLLNITSEIPSIDHSKLLANIKEFVSAEKSQGKSLKSTEFQLSHVNSISMLSNFSISHFTLRKFEGVDASISWMMLGLSALIIIVPILACCGTCKCCRTGAVGIVKSLCYLLRGLVILIYKLFRYLCSSSKEPQSTETRGKEAVESRTADIEGNNSIFLEKLPPKLDISWYTIKISEERILIFGDDHSQTYSYCPLLNVIKDAKSEIVEGIIPSKPFMKEYRQKIENLNIPLFEMTHGRKVLVNFPDTYFDESAYKYRNIITNDKMAGFRVPFFIISLTIITILFTDPEKRVGGRASLTGKRGQRLTR
jgi:hypothetical protein